MPRNSAFATALIPVLFFVLENPALFGSDGDFVFRGSLESVSTGESAAVTLRLNISGFGADVLVTESTRLRTSTGQALTLDELPIGSALEITADWIGKGFVATAITVPEIEQAGVVGAIDRILPWQLVVSGVEFDLDENSAELADRLAAGAMVAVVGYASPKGTLSAAQVISQEQFWLLGKISAKDETARTIVVSSRTISVPEKARVLAPDRTALEFARLTAGMMVSVTGSATGGKLTAEEVRVVEASGRVEIRGQFVSATASSITVKSLDTLFNIKTDAKTEIVGALTAGAMVNVSAVLQADGSLLAVRIIAKTVTEGTKTNEVGLSGTIEKMDASAGTISVQGTAVKISSTTIISSAGRSLKITDLKVGDKVKITGTKADGVILATRIEVMTSSVPSSEVAFDGTIEKMAADGKSIVVRGVSVLITEKTQILFPKDLTSIPSLKIGDKVKVTGTKQADGSVVAALISVIPATTPSTEELFSGTVEKISQDGKTIVVNRITVLITDQTKIVFLVSTAAVQTLKIGDLVKVAGKKQADGSVLATRIDVMPPTTPSAEIVFDGTIEKISQSPDIIVVRGTKVFVTAESKIQAGEKMLKFADLKLGDLVKIKGLKQADGTVKAVLIVVVPK